MNDTTTANGKAVDERWPTASKVASQLGCSRQQVYKLAARGKLRAKDVRENGVKKRRFDPSIVRDLAEAQDELDALLEQEETDDEEPEDESVSAGNASRLAGKVVSEFRQVAVDARRGQQEAFELVTKPAREFTETLLKALDQREKRIAELEEKLNKFYDEQREARLEEREAAMMQARLERADARKDEFFKLFTDNLPVVLTQLKESAGGGGGPFAKWIKKIPPEKQEKLIMAIEAVLGDEEPPSASAQEKGTQ